MYVAREDSRNRHSRQHVVILLAVRQRTGQRHFLLVINDTFLEEASDDSEVLDVDGEDRLTLRQRREVVELYAYVAGRVRTEDLIESAVLEFAELGCFGATLDADEHRSQLAQGGYGSLQGRQLAFEHPLVVRSHGSRVKRRNKDSTRSLVRQRDAVVRTLFDERPETGLEKELLHITCGVELLVLNRSVSLDVNRHHLASLAADDRHDFTRHRRSKLHLLKRLVVKERRTGFHEIAFMHVQLGRDTGEMVGHNMKDLRTAHATQRFCRRSLKRNVQTTFQFDLLHKCLLIIV